MKITMPMWPVALQLLLAIVVGLIVGHTAWVVFGWLLGTTGWMAATSLGVRGDDHG